MMIIFFALILLAGCEETDTLVAESPDEAVAEKIAEEQVCAGVICGVNQQCKAGVCGCGQKFKLCGDACIPTAGCCVQDDCDDNHFCADDNQCRKKPETCSYNQEWDAAKESCKCAAGNKFCQEQNKCIPEKNCCVYQDCTLRRDICVKTSYLASVCINDPALHCKGVIEGQQALFNLPTTEFKVRIKNILEQGKTIVTINDEQKTLDINAPHQLDTTTTIKLEQIKTIGGVCKTYND